MNKIITEEQIKEIVMFLENVTVPAIVGLQLIAICDRLRKLPDIKEKE
jgi:hypothetical protein